MLLTHGYHILGEATRSKEYLADWYIFFFNVCRNFPIPKLQFPNFKIVDRLHVAEQEL